MLHGTNGWFVFATLLVVLGMTPPAAAVDLSGDYVVTIPIPCRVTVVQTGTAVQTTGFCDFGGSPTPFSFSGPVNPVTGAFSGTSDLGGVCSGVISGTGDGEVIIATATSPCYSGPIFATKCGNGVIDPLENCEDGNAMDGDCCSARCRLDAAGTACTSDGNNCTDDVCNATGTCTHVPNTSPCDDGNACTIDDLCAAGACVPGSPAPAGHACDDDFDPCTADVCDEAGTCTHVLVPPGECRRAVECHSTCTQQLKACWQTCPWGGQARRECRAACAERSTCTAPGAAIRTLAYVVTDCSTDPQGRSALKQKLLIRRGNCDPITVTEVIEVPPSKPILDLGHCQQFGNLRWGSSSVAYGALQRLGVSRDGSGVVFEVNDEFSIFPLSPFTLLPPEKKGFFFVRSNGTGRRRLGPASRERSFGGASFAFPPPISFSPTGRRIAFTDRGPGPGGEQAAQIVVLDLQTGTRTPVTQLPSGTPPTTFFGPFLLTCCPTFIDDETVLFVTFVDPVVNSIHLNPEHNFAAFTVRIDGSQFTALPTPVAPPGSKVVPTFGVTGRRTNLVRLYLPGTPVSHPVPPGCGVPPAPPCADFPIAEVFLQDGKNLLQLTNLRSADTFIGFVNGTRTRAFFMSSVDPIIGENPHGNCQIFSVDTLGSGLRQITHFNQGGSPPSIPGCFGANAPACSVGEGYLRVVVQDPVTNAVVFASSCDPVGANPYGGQLFAMRPDGHGLRQLTDAAGFATNPDGSIRVELPGPFAYSAAVP